MDCEKEGLRQGSPLQNEVLPYVDDDNLESFVVPRPLPQGFVPGNMAKEVPEVNKVENDLPDLDQGSDYFDGNFDAYVDYPSENYEAADVLPPRAPPGFDFSNRPRFNNGR